MFTTHHLPRSPSFFIFMSFHFVWLNFAAPPAHRWTSAVCVCVECSAGWYSKWRRNSSRANITELCGNRTVAAAFSRFRDIEMKKKNLALYIYFSYDRATVVISAGNSSGKLSTSAQIIPLDSRLFFFFLPLSYNAVHVYYIFIVKTKNYYILRDTLLKFFPLDSDYYWY